MHYISMLALECPMTKTQSQERTEVRYRNWSEFSSTTFHVKTTENGRCAFRVNRITGGWCLTLRWYSHDPASKRSLEKPRAETSQLIWEVWSIREYWYRWSRSLNAGYEAFLNSKVHRRSMNGWKCWNNSSLEKILPLYKQNWRKNTTYVIFE